MKQSKSPLTYQRLKDVRGARRRMPDRPMTATPRYEEKTTLSHRRSERRIERWAKYA